MLRPMIALALLLALVLSPRAQAANAPAPLYMITYDHGGLILWGMDHFAERLRNAISWLDRYPSLSENVIALQRGRQNIRAHV